MWKVRDLPLHEKRIYPTLTSFSVLPFLPLLQLLACLSGYMCGNSLTLKFDFHNYTGLNGLVNSFPYFTIAPPNKLILGWKPHWSRKRKKKTTSCKKWLLGGILQKSYPKNFSKFTKKYPRDSLFLTMLKVFMALGLQLY